MFSHLRNFIKHLVSCLSRHTEIQVVTLTNKARSCDMLTTHNYELLDAVQVANDGQCVVLVVGQSIGHCLGCVVCPATHVTSLSEPLLHVVVI